MRRCMLLTLCISVWACDKAAEPAQPAQPGPASAKAEAPPAPAPTPEKPAADTTATAQVGAAAPDFTLTDLDGKTHTLSDYRGKLVVLEWFNPQCPFVNHAHTEGSLVTMAKDETAKGVVWLAINSGAPGKQGHGAEANAAGKTKFGLEHPILLDADGAVGHRYGAKKTPHVFLVDTEGTLVYGGAIDNAPFGEVDGGGPKIGYLAKALAELRAGTAVSTPQTPPYGCTVKYG